LIDDSPALGNGWRLGFLGVLHMDVFNQRLEQEYGAQVVLTSPNVPVKGKFHKRVKVILPFIRPSACSQPLTLCPLFEISLQLKSLE